MRRKCPWKRGSLMATPQVHRQLFPHFTVMPTQILARLFWANWVGIRAILGASVILQAPAVFPGPTPQPPRTRGERTHRAKQGHAQKLRHKRRALELFALHIDVLVQDRHKAMRVIGHRRSLPPPRTAQPLRCSSRTEGRHAEQRASGSHGPRGAAANRSRQ